MTDKYSNSSYNHQHASQQFTQDNSDNRVLAMLIYLLSFFTTLFAPLIIWLLKRNESKLIDQAGKNYFNFFISYFIWSIVLTVLIFISYLMLLSEQTSLLIIGGILMIIFGLGLFILSILSFIFTIVACVKYMSNEIYLIPLSIRFFK